MSAYFSDWDRSYHITTVSGGDSKESIQAFVSGIGLKKGGKYHFSFQGETSEGTEIPFAIKSKSTGETIYEDVFVGTGSKTLYEAEVSSTVAGDAEIVFSLGGENNLRFSIYELKLVKFE